MLTGCTDGPLPLRNFIPCALRLQRARLQRMNWDPKFRAGPPCPKQLPRLLLKCMKSNSSRRWVAWIGVAAILINSFGPSISHTLAGRDAPAWVAFGAGTFDSAAVVCGQSGRAPGPDSGHLAAAHCLYCAPSGASFAIPLSHLSNAVAGTGPDLLVVHYALTAPRLSAWAVAQARAPPSFS